MKKLIFCAAMVLISAAVFSQNLHAESIGKQLLSIKLKAPANNADAEYLGIKGTGAFRIPDIACDVLLVEIFSMYCPHCQKEAPGLNEFFRLLENSERYADRIKMIGIGVGNSAFEVNYFRDKYDIRFPLFPDQDFAIHKTIGEVRTPYFIGIKFKEDGSAGIFLSEAGPRGKPEVFFRDLIQMSGLESSMEDQ